MSEALRVGLVCPYSFSRAGGVQNHVLGLAGWLLEQGHDVEVFGPGRVPGQVLEEARLPASAVVSSGPAVPVRYNGSVARVNLDPVSAARTRNWLRRGDFDLIHVHEPMTPSVSLVGLLQSRSALVATFHTATPGSRSMRLAYRLVPSAGRRLAGAIAVSQLAAEVVESHGGPSSTVIGNGIGVASHFAPPTRGPWRAGDHPRVVFVGRYDEPRKGFDLLLDALPELREVHPDLELVVVGEGNPRKAPGVTFLGPLGNQARNRVLATGDAYVAPHRGRESFGIVLLEALASGTPVVAANLPPFREVLSDAQGPVGHLFAPGDSRDLATALLTSLAQPRDLHLERGRRRAASFDWNQVGPRIEEVYRRARSSQPTPTSVRT